MRTCCILVLLASLVPGDAWGQYDYTPPPRVDASEMAARWISGRYVMPVTCKREGQPPIHIEQAVVVRPEPEQVAAPHTVRATFFGIDVAGAEHCYNLIDSRMLDRRGVLFFHFPSRRREDTGVSDFRHALKSGQLRFHISAGRIRTRAIGEAEPKPEAEVISFDRAGATLTARILSPNEDGYRALASLAPPDPRRNEQVRRLEFLIERPGGGSFSAYFIEDWK